MRTILLPAISNIMFFTSGRLNGCGLPFIPEEAA